MSARILLVEDEPAHALLIQSILDGCDVVITHADNGDHAVKLIGSETYDLVLTDFILPEKDGLELAKHIRSQDTVNKDIPILLISTYFQPGEESALIEAGITEWQAKPIKADKLREAVLRLLDMS
ncbi:MAG: response regulator [Desulfovibrio sp.]|nr:MAG: response regulator [Desulfovibrio sp.]